MMNIVFICSFNMAACANEGIGQKYAEDVERSTNIAKKIGHEAIELQGSSDDVYLNKSSYFRGSLPWMKYMCKWYKYVQFKFV